MVIHSSEALDRTFAALADPTRRAMLARLAHGEADVSELMQPFGLSQPAISRHLKVLERAGLVTRRMDAQRRPRTLVATPLADVDRWLEPFRAHWEARFTQLDRYLRTVQSTHAKSRTKAGARATKKRRRSN